MRVRLFDAIFRSSVILAVSVAIFTATSSPGSASAQQSPQVQNPPLAPRTTLPGGAPESNNDEDPMVRHMSAQLAKSRNNLRQQQLVADTTKLLELATELKTEVDKSNKDTLSLAVVKKAEEIEKLAKSVKEKMRNGQ
jgi:type VI protein secretion system component VasF